MLVFVSLNTPVQLGNIVVNLFVAEDVSFQLPAVQGSVILLGKPTGLGNGFGFNFVS